MNKNLLIGVFFFFSIFSCFSQNKLNKDVVKYRKTSQIISKETFSIMYCGHIYIMGEIDNVIGNLIFDTGAKNLYLDSLYYSTNNFNYPNATNAFLPGVGIKPQKVKVVMDSVSFQFSNFLYKTNFVPIINLKSILGDFADGIIGIDYFTNTIIEINYEKQYINIFNNLDSLNINEYSKIKCKRIANKLYVPIIIHISESIEIEGDFLLDIGSGGAISLTSTVANKHNLDNKINHKTKFFTKYGGIGGKSESYYFNSNSISLGSYKINNVVLNYSIDKTGSLSSNIHSGLLGNHILDKFDLIIDYKDNNIYIKPNSTYNKPYKFSKLGFKYVDRSLTLKAWVITGFFKGTSAEKSGLLIDDMVTHINDKPIIMINNKEQNEIFDTEKIIKITIKRNGKNKDYFIELRDFIN